MSVQPADAAAFSSTTVGRVAEIRLGKMLQPKPNSPGDYEVSYLRAGSLERLGGTEALRKMWASPAEAANYEVRSGDLIVAEGGDVGRSAFVPEVPAHTIIQNSLHRIRPRAGDARFLKYALEAVYHSGWLNVLCNKATFGHLTREKLASLRVPWPSDNQQRVIADFLDAETARIDALIAKKRRLDDVVRLRLSALIGTATTEGRPIQVRRLVSLRTSGPRGWAERVGPSGVPFVRSANLQVDSLNIKWDGMAFVEDTKSAEAERSRVRAGDVLVGITGANTGWVGFAEQGHDGGYVSQHVGLLRPRGLNPKWLAYAVFSPPSREQLLGGQYGGTKQQLSLDELAELTVHVPSLKRQEELVSRLDHQVVVADQLRIKLRSQLALLAEHRQALVTAAVTGQLEVPGVAA